MATHECEVSMFIEVPASKKSFGRRKPKHGVGINDARYMTCMYIDGKQTMCPFYRAWKNMLKRCYDKKYQLTSKSYIGCSVCQGWLYFSNFRRWMEIQDWRGKELDKDILISGNKVYSPESCIFVSRAINSLLTDGAAARGRWPIGVHVDKNRIGFIASCREKSKGKIYITGFESPDSAHKAYCKLKSRIVEDSALKEDGALRFALLRIASEISSGEYYRP